MIRLYLQTQHFETQDQQKKCQRILSGMERNKLAKLVSLGEAWETKKVEDQEECGLEFSKKEYDDFLAQNREKLEDLFESYAQYGDVSNKDRVKASQLVRMFQDMQLLKEQRKSISPTVQKSVHERNTSQNMQSQSFRTREYSLTDSQDVPEPEEDIEA